MHRTITKESTLNGTKRKLCRAIGSKVRPARSPKGVKGVLLRLFMHKLFNRSVVIDDLAREDVDEISSSKKGMIQIF
jgi:hypothetical protein